MLKRLFFWFLVVFFLAVSLNWLSSFSGKGLSGDPKVDSESAALHLKIEGPIFETEPFLKDLRKYRRSPKIKGIFVEIDSPGGAVGPSQELFHELKRTREKFEKPVFVYSRSLLASGALYAAVGADKIFVQEGTLVGSIGVIMRLVNLEGVYDWAKVKSITIKTGEFKDTGTETRSPTPRETEYLQSMVNEALAQFKSAIESGRNMTTEQVAEVADGRVFSGSRAVDLKLVDAIGTLEEAVAALAEQVGVGEDDLELWEPPVEKTWLQMAGLETLDRAQMKFVEFANATLDLHGKPLFILPGFLGN